MHYIIGVLLGGALLFGSLAWWNTSRAEMIMAEARAHAITVEADANAKATLMIAAVPLVAIAFGGLGFTCLGLAALTMAIKWTPPASRYLPSPQPCIRIEPGMTRADLWRMLSNEYRPELPRNTSK